MLTIYPKHTIMSIDRKVFHPTEVSSSGYFIYIKTVHHLDIGDPNNIRIKIGRTVFQCSLYRKTLCVLKGVEHNLYMFTMNKHKEAKLN